MTAGQGGGRVVRVVFNPNIPTRIVMFQLCGFTGWGAILQVSRIVGDQTAHKYVIKFTTVV